MSRFSCILVFISACLASLGSVTWADEIFLKDGTRIVGKVVSMEEETLKVESPLINDEAELTIDWENVERIVSDQPLKVNVIVGEEVQEDEFDEVATMDVTTLEGSERLPLDRVESINVPDVRYDVKLDAGGNRTSGNTDTGAVNLSLDSTVRGRQHGFGLEAKFNRAEADGEATAENWRVKPGYKYLVTRKWFIAAIELLEQDKFQDLNIRSSTAVGGGYLVFDSSTHELAGAVGPAFVYQEFDTTGVTKTPSLFWAINWLYQPIKDDVELFHKQTGYKDVGSTSDAIRWNADQGVRVTVWGDLYLKLEFGFRFNSDPEPGKETTDESLIFGVGYKVSN